MLDQLRQQLKALRKELHDKGMVLADEEVFYDRERLNQADRWGHAIERAVDECELLIFLVSVDALASDFCIPKEVTPALSPRADGRPPATVVPVLLHATARWTERQVLPAEAEGKPVLLGELHSGGLPKARDRDANNAKAISSWGNRAEAWDSVATDLREVIVRRLFPAHVAPVARASGRGAMPLVAPSVKPAYLCNQDTQWKAFDDARIAWKSQRPLKSLLVLLQGEEADSLAQFAERLRVRHLKPHVTSLGRALRERPYELKRPWTAGQGQTPGIGMLQSLFEQLDPDSLVDRLDYCRDHIEGAAELLRSHLHGRADIAAVICPLPRRNAAAELHGFLRFLQACKPQGDEMGRLVIFFLDDQSAGARGQDWIAARLTSAWGDVQVLPPLSEIGLDEADQWRTDERMDALLSLSQLEAMFKPPQKVEPPRRWWSWSRPPAAAAAPAGPAECRLRLREFAEQVERILARQGPQAASSP